MLLRHFIISWWLVVGVLGVTAVLSVSYSEGEEAASQEEIPEEWQEDAFEEGTSEEESLIQQLQSRLRELEEWERRLQKREEQLNGIKRELESLADRQAQKSERLTIRANELEAEKKRMAQQDPSLEHVIKVYEAMDPEEAALRIEKMQERLALDILAGIKDKKAAGVLAGVEPAKAAKLSEGLRRYRKIQAEQN